MPEDRPFVRDLTVGPDGSPDLPPALPPGRYLLVEAGDDRTASLARQALLLLGRRLADVRRQPDEARIARLVEALVEHEPRPAPLPELEADSASRRADYLEDTAFLTAGDINDLAGSAARNRSALASRWKREGRVFAVPVRGVDLFPAFQFADGTPRPAVRRVLAALPADFTPWQTALWFAAGNEWLGGAAPQDRLHEPEAVVAAAERLADPASA